MAGPIIARLFAVMLAAVALGMASPGQERFARSSVVEAVDLRTLIDLGGDGLVILDVRTIDEFERGHVPGAVRLGYEEWEVLSHSEKTGLEHADEWRERIGRLGIGTNDAVIVYDNGKMTRAARVWFLLQHFGVSRVAVVNGGYPLIQLEAARRGLQLTSAPTLPEPDLFDPPIDPSGRIGVYGRIELKDRVDRREVQVLDARTTDEHRGIDLRDNERGGHLPTAISLPHMCLLDGENRLRPPEELDRMLADAGFVKGEPIVTHCQGGGRAALAALACARAGYGPVFNYYLSFGDWSADASCPVVVPE